jgi:exo-beta-1,3-glucanase (GH17 family)
MEPEPINVDEIADDEDDGLFDPPQRRSVPSLGRDSSNDINAAAGAAASGGMLGSIGGMFKGGNGGSGAGPSYGIVPGSAEKKRWLGVRNGRKHALIRALLLGFVILGGIIGGIVAGIVVHFKNNSSGSSNSSSGGGGGGGANSGGSNSDQSDFDKNSPEIQALMNNQNLHKVFPGMDYTPWGVQYPLCLQYPPIQNNVTQDLAVLSQLTNTVRLYGTDCNQTEMTLHAIDRLGLTDMKVWLGVWIDTNTTTNDRQLTQLYNVIDSTKDKSIFKGAIIGNEVLYRASPDTASAETTLISYIQSVRANFTQRNLNLPLATSDLGDNWNAQLTQAVDVVMSNVHPFFGGVAVDQAAAWTWTFWESHDVSLTQGATKQQVISEVGWPSGGGNDCGTTAGCSNAQAGAVSGIDEMNKFMSDFVCQSLSNRTEYFWFEAFDEPWKAQFNVPGQEWEDKWGLMDAARNLKAGLNIPDCGGKQATAT